MRDWLVCQARVHLGIFIRTFWTRICSNCMSDNLRSSQASPLPYQTSGMDSMRSSRLLMCSIDQHSEHLATVEAGVLYQVEASSCISFDTLKIRARRLEESDGQTSAMLAVAIAKILRANLMLASSTRPDLGHRHVGHVATETQTSGYDQARRDYFGVSHGSKL